ncbi:xylulokinase [Mesobacterium sp. TK19101]|uniref:Xylulose kinase n=1 Tax=Mesobacterium hydrothermale TaxID=3111907 RepID=A0ABU6HKQ5_9RHOB|nr:xylulokinase [Mesobacterium sp. TK19101]MEC3863040.1 xylulokinase [Mesobacterium sp. TK19101]
MYLGIDIGTSGVKAVRMDPSGRLVQAASVALTISHAAPGWSEQAPEDWWQAVCRAVRQLDGLGDVRAIGLSGQMHGAVLLDGAGAVLRPAILWNDGRCSAECAAVWRDAPDLAQVAGVRPMPGLTGPKLAWVAVHEPQVHARIRHLLLPKDYIGYRLHGRFVTDRGDAGGSFLFDQARGRWSDALCAATRTDPAWLPEVLAGIEVAGTLTAQAAEALGLPGGLPVVAGAADAPAGALAAGVVRDGRGMISLGTSGQFLVAAQSYSAAPDQGLHSFAHTLPDTWYHMAALLNGARPMQWFADMVQAPVAALLDEAAVTDQGIPLFLPYLTGERTPHGDDTIRAGFYGIGNATTRGQMLRGVLDGIAYAFADAAQVVGDQMPPPEVMLVQGGGARSPLLLQTIADVIGLTLARIAGAEAGPAIGAARLAAVADGAMTLDDLAQQPETDLTITPGDMGRHGARLQAYRQMYQALKPLRGSV